MASPTEYEQLKASNDAREEKLAVYGAYPGGKNVLYQNMLLESILGHLGGPDAIMDARLLTEQMRQEKIEEIEKQVGKPQLIRRPHGIG